MKCGFLEVFPAILPSPARRFFRPRPALCISLILPLQFSENSPDGGIPKAFFNE
jgi:hypothetical protein